jgi:predicted amidohydrolase YtcJ
VAALLTLLLAVATAPTPGKDLLLEGGIVYASADARPAAASLLIQGGKIAFMGGVEEARRRSGAASRVELHGAFVFPGWTDVHLHLLGLGQSLESADLRDAATADDAAVRMGTAAARLPAGLWVEGFGWDQNRWPGAAFPDARALDRAVPHRPAVARRVDGHAVWINSAALEAAGITASTPDPENGQIVRRPDGSPSGVLIDGARALIRRVQPKASVSDRDRWLRLATAACARSGLTEVGDASAYDADDVGSLEKLAGAGALPIRVYATVSSQAASLNAFFAKGPRLGGDADFLTVRAIKVYADGALGSRGAALLEDYSDAPGQRGWFVTTPERMAEVALEARRRGWQLWIHAIGDRGNRAALDAIESAERSVPEPPRGGDRARIEHAQVVAPADFPRFGRLGVIASIQPTHATSDMLWAEQRLGPVRVEGAYAWRRLVDGGARLAGGSDAPVESERPLLGFYAAVTRTDLSGRPAGGWHPSQKLTRPEALALFTSGAAYAAFEEERRGRIAPGMEADLTVLARDPMAVPASEIPTIPVVLTLVGGRVAYERAAP